VIDEELRPGTGDPVFMISGAGGSAAELEGLAGALDGAPRVIALVPLPTGEADTVEAMAASAVAVIRTHQPSGPYRLLGYSLGGVVALETGRLLREAGEDVGFLGLVEALFDRRHWPRGLLIRARSRRYALLARTLLTTSPARGGRELRERVGRRRRAAAAPTIQDANLAILARWRPRGLDAPVVLFTAAENDFGCDLAELWQPWLPQMRVERLPGDHLRLVQEPALLARAVDRALAGAGSPPLRVLVASTFRWSGAARLAVDLHAAGCVVHGAAPRGSALHEVAAVERSHVLGLATPVGSLRAAIEASGADIVVPFDDRTRRTLHRIHGEAGAELRARLERTLGPPGLYPRIYSRVAVMDTAAECGVRCPPTAAVGSAEDIARWLGRHPGPAVLKTDGSWGGRETRVIHGAHDARKAWRQLSRPPGFARCVKRALYERDPWPLRARLDGRRPRLSIQAFVEGSPGNVAVACLEGEVLGAVQAEVLQANGPTGPSTVLRVVEHPEMLATARAMVRRLRLSGLVGLDFVLEPDGRAHLIELNPRATPTSHLVSAEGVDLLAALRSALGHAGPPPRSAAYPGGLVALFPQELERDPASTLVLEAHHDVPWHAPDLVARAAAGLRIASLDELRTTPPARLADHRRVASDELPTRKAA
jgi:thioesterase domain-containing protein